MRKCFLLIILVFACAFMVSAQEQDPWVGTWTSESYTDMDWENSPKDSEGSFTEIKNTDYKLVIRITKNGDQYNVRAKTIKVKDPTYSSYHKHLTFKRMSGNTMWLESYVEKMPFTVDYGNGPFIESYSDNTYYIKLTLSNGVLHYSFYKYHTINYDRNMNYKGEDTMDVSNRPGHSLDLFNDDW